MGTFRDNHNAETFAEAAAFAHDRTNFRDIIRDFREENNITAAGNAGFQCQPAGISAHYFDEHYPVMGLRGCVKAIDGFRCYLPGGIETESNISFHQIVIDRFWYADNIRPFFAQLSGDRHGAITADANQCFQTEVFV